MPRHREIPHELMERAARGEESAARHALLDFHRDDLRRMVQARMDPRMGVRVDASDVVQDVLIDAWRRLDAYLRDRPLPFLPWLRQIVGERIIDMHRRHISSQCRGVKREERLEINEESAEALAGRLSTNDTSPSNRFLRTETQGRLRRRSSRFPRRTVRFSSCAISSISAPRRSPRNWRSPRAP